MKKVFINSCVLYTNYLNIFNTPRDKKRLVFTQLHVLCRYPRSNLDKGSPTTLTLGNYCLLQIERGADHYNKLKPIQSHEAKSKGRGKPGSK